ncbi:hypothetical protein NCCP133_31820 [Cytobacillus sp. NCCP-133]|nr:hypothetical protein NCCP133_31820 [Cytobacillus sp. NCCP-133]
MNKAVKETLWTKSFIMLLVGNLFVFMSFHMLIPTLTPYIKSIGAAGLLAITVIYPLSSVVVIFLLFRLIHGLAWGWSTMVNGTAAVDVVPNSRLGEGMG